MERKLTTIVAMDVVGYSRLMEMDEKGTLDRLKEARSSIIDPAIARHSGRTVKLMGDGTLAEFASVVDALQCTVDIQRELATRNGSAGEQHGLQLRIGLHLGDVIVDGDDIYGDGVNVASRLENIAQPGGIVLSKQVHDHIGANVAVRFVSLGEQSVKNISRPIEAYRVDFGIDDTHANVIRFGNFELDTAQLQLREAGDRIPIEPQVFDLLVFLARNTDRTVTKGEIFAAIWGDRIVSDAALSSQIKAARRAVRDDGVSQHTISTVHGRGFRFVAPIENVSRTAGDRVDVGRRRESSSAVATKPSVAVLPFANLNRDSDEDYFADGIAEDITSALSKNRWLTIVARNSAFAFRASNDSIRIIGEKLNANYIVTGNVRKAGTRFRITVQVVNADTEQSVWSERFDRDMVDIFELQDEISEMVSSPHRIGAWPDRAEKGRAQATQESRGVGPLSAWRRGVLQIHPRQQSEVPGAAAQID